MIAGREYYLTEWNILDYIRCRTPYFDHALKRPQDRAGPSGMDSAVKRLKLAARYFQTERQARAYYKAGKDDGDIREVNVGEENNRGSTKENRKRQVVEFNKVWVETLD